VTRSVRATLVGAFVVALHGVFLITPVAAAPQNYVQNAGFEDLCDTSGTPCHWPGATTSTTAHTGSRSLAVGTTGVISDCFPTTGTQWDVRWWHRANGATTTSPDQIRVWFYSDATCGRLLALSEFNAALNEADWTDHGMNSIVGGTNGSIRVEARQGANAGGQPPALFDDILIRIQDQQRPSGTISIDAGAQYAASRNVTLSLNATDDWGVTAYRLSDGDEGVCVNSYPTVPVAEQTSYSASVSWTLTGREGPNQVCVQYLDERGNVSSIAMDTIVLDSLPPLLAITSPADGAVYEPTDDVRAAYSCSEPAFASGVATCDPTTFRGSTINMAPGVHTFSLTSRDNLGHEASTSVTYRVLSRWVFGGFQSPVNGNGVTNIARAGRTIPLRWHVADTTGSPVTNLTGVTVSSDNYECGATSAGDGIEEYDVGGSGLQNLGGGDYQFNWATPTAYAGTCRILHLDLGDGIQRDAIFRFTR
jgi:hypothetical protein